MIGYDDVLAGYLATEADENVNNTNNLKGFDTFKNSSPITSTIASENTNTFIIADEETVLIEELPTDSESEINNEFEPEQYKWIDDSQEKEVEESDDSEKSLNYNENELNEIDVIIPLESDGIEIELTGPEKQEQEIIQRSSDTFYDVVDDQENENEENFPCSLQLTEPNYSQLLESETPVNLYQEICRICNSSDFNDSDDWLMCYGCGEAFHRTCLKEKLRKVKCEMPLIYRNRLEGPEENQSKIFSHAPWFCNKCVKCSHCKVASVAEVDETKQDLMQNLKESFASCRHCGKVMCLACYNSESFSNYSIQLNGFSDLKNYSCPSCLQCINCGLNAKLTSSENRRKSTMSLAKQTVILYEDLTLCRPCYLSNQICATCPRCKQIYHSLPDHYDFGEANYNSDFSLCPMVSCDDCGSWTHCQCEGISEKEYERLGMDKSAKFTCVNCKPKNMTKRMKTNVESVLYNPKNVDRFGNLFFKDEKIFFNFWSFSEPWKRKTYQLNFSKKRLVLEIDENDKIEADSLTKLIAKFKEKFRNVRFEGLNCLKAANPQFLFDPMRLLTFLESKKSFKEFFDYLRDEILSVEEFVCARTRPLEALQGAFVKKPIDNKRRLSLTNFSETKSSPEPMVNTGKMTVKYLYSQYVHTLKSDLAKSINTTDVFSIGLALRPSAISGFGLFATRQFQRNSLIIEYCGEMLTGEPMVNKRDAYYNAMGKRYRQSCYLFRLDELKVLDATHKGNLSRFINHSCDPNCYSRVVQIDSHKKLLIFASKVIESGEEIVYDYKFPDEEQKIPCLCGSEKCRKWMN